MQSDRSTVRKKTFRIVTVLVLAAVTRLTVHAAGTPAGTTITNQAHATYRAHNGVLMPSIVSNVVGVVVGQAASVNVTPPSASRTSQVNTAVDFPSVVTNSGNGTDNLQLTAASSHGFAAAIYRDLNRNGVLDPGEIAAGVLTQTGSLPADSSAWLVLRLTVPNNQALNGQTDLLTLTATSGFDGTVHGSGTYSTVISSASLALTVSVSNTVPRGGDRVTYTIAYANPGSSAAAGVEVTDALDIHLNYVVGSGTPSIVSGRTLTWSLGSIPAGGAGTIVFQVDIVNNTPPGTEIHNTGQGRFTDGPNSITVSSTEQNFMTVQAGGAATVDIGPSHVGSGEPGDTLVYPLIITNNGALPEAFTFSALSNTGLVWTYYTDLNGNGRVDSSEAMTTGTGTLAGGGGQDHVLVRTVLPLVQQDGTLDGSSFLVTSTTNTSNRKTATGNTTIQIPVMALAKLADAPDPRPGHEIRYQITYSNTGGGHAYQFAVQDSVPANTSYVPQSVTLNSIQKTDEADGDEVHVAGGLITVTVGTVIPRSSGVLAFRVRIQ